MMKTKETVTLDRLLSRLGIASRSQAHRAILNGRITVNGRITRNPSRWIHPASDFVALDGEPLRSAQRVYLLFHKPKGIITSRGDPHRRKTVYDFIQEIGHWVSPVGRLDKETSGLLLLTNDTDFAEWVSNPQSQIPKTYRLEVRGSLSGQTLASLRAGMSLKRGDRARPQSVRWIGARGGKTGVEIVLTEGKNREVRRMIEAIGSKVLKLVRTGIGPLTLEGLRPGQWRYLRPREIEALRAYE